MTIFVGEEKLLDLVNKNIVPKVNKVREFQDVEGRIIREFEESKQVLIELIKDVKDVYNVLGMNKMGESFELDILNWFERGLGNVPYFDNSLSIYHPPLNNETTFFIAPINTPNGPGEKGFYLEAFLAVRDEPKVMDKIEQDLPHPKNGCQSLKLISGTKGFMEGKCIVFFPENVKTEQKITEQNFAIFFFNKFHKIYNEDTVKRVKMFFKDFQLCSENMSLESTYQARVIWGYLHDYFHHCGKKPFDQNIQAKMNFFAGILEEIKVDCQAIIKLKEKNYPYANEIIEFVLFERLLRYPSQVDAPRNFDAGTGFFLFSWLLKNSDSIKEQKGSLSLNLELCIKDLQSLVDEIEEIEEIKSADEYKKIAKDYVRKYLPNTDNGDKFAIPNSYFLYEDNLNLSIAELKFYDFVI